jgi:hypothetical protein
MLRRIRDIFRRNAQDDDFRHEGFRLRGQRQAAKARNRVLLLADAYGPTLQINFIRPLRYQATLQDNWAWWTLTEDAVQERATANGTDKAVTRIKALFATFQPTLIIASRYGGLFTEEIIDFARRARVPLLSHIDDNLLAVPQSNGDATYAKHADEERQQALRALLLAADLNYISTQPLYEQLLTLNVLCPDVVVGGIAGAAAPLTSGPRGKSSGFVFGYMGSKSHTGDLEMIAPAIAAVLDKFPQARFETFGSVGLPVALSGYEITRHGRMKNYDHFLRHLSTLDWNVGLAPLALNAFTMAKTNIKWIEYTSAGIPVLASNHPIYRDCCREGAGVLIDDDWLEQISRMIETPSLGIDLLSQARHRLDKEYNPHRLHAQLMTVLKAAGMTLA